MIEPQPAGKVVKFLFSIFGKTEFGFKSRLFYCQLQVIKCFDKVNLANVY